MLKMGSNQKKTYREQGFLNGIDLFSDDEIIGYRKQFDAFEARLGRETCQIGLVNSHFEERFVWDMSTDPGMLDQMQDLIGEDLMVLGTHYLLQISGGNHRALRGLAPGCNLLGFGTP